MVQLHGEEGPSFCVEVARRTGAKVIKAMHVTSAADVQAAEAFRTDFHLFDPRGTGSGAGPARASTGTCCAERRSEVPMILAGGLSPENVAEAIARHPALRGRRRQRGRGRAGSQGPRRDGSVLRGAPGGLSVPSRRPASEHRSRGALRPLRRPLRARDADRGARRARPPPGPRRARTRTSGRARARCCATSSAGRRRSTSPSGSRSGSAAGLPEARGPRPHRRPQDQQRGRPGAAGPADGQDADDRRDRRRPARRRDGDRLRAVRARVRRLHGHRGHPPPGARTSSGCGCSAPRSSPSRPAPAR